MTSLLSFINYVKILCLYSPPSQINNVFNTTEYNNSNDTSSGMSQLIVNTTFLQKVGNPVSSASSTTFNGSLTATENVDVGTAASSF